MQITSSTARSWGYAAMMALGYFKTKVVELKDIQFCYLYAAGITLESLQDQRIYLRGRRTFPPFKSLRFSCTDIVY